MVRTAYAHLRSRGKRARRCPRSIRPRPPASARRWRPPRRPRWRRSARPSSRRCERRMAKARALRRPARAARSDGALARARRASRAWRPSRRPSAARAPPCAAYREAHAAYEALCVRHARVPRPRAAARADRALRRPLRRAQARPLRPGLRRPRAARARPAARRRGPARPLRASASPTCWSTSSRTRTRSRTRSSSCSERDNLFRVGDERQSIYRFRHADVEVFRSATRRRRRPGGPSAIDGELPQPRRGARRDRPRRSPSCGARTSTRCVEAPGRARGAAARSSPASSCS